MQSDRYGAAAMLPSRRERSVEASSLQVRRRCVLALFASVSLVGCGGAGTGTEDAEAPLESVERDLAVALARAEGSGFSRTGPFQRVLIDSVAQMFHFGSFKRVLVAPLTPGQSVFVTRDLPATVADDEVLVVGSKNLTEAKALEAKVLDAKGARYFSVRTAGIANCAVALYLGV